MVIEIIASYFPYGLKIMSRNTLSEPQPVSASNVHERVNNLKLLCFWTDIHESEPKIGTKSFNTIVPNNNMENLSSYSFTYDIHTQCQTF